MMLMSIEHIFSEPPIWSRGERLEMDLSALRPLVRTLMFLILRLEKRLAWETFV